MNLFLKELNRLLHEREYNPALNHTAITGALPTSLHLMIFSFFGGFGFQLAPRYTQVAVTSELGSRVLVSFGLTQKHLLSGVDPFVVNTGNAFLLVPLPDDLSVAELRPHLHLIESISESVIRVVLDVVDGKISRLMAGGTALAVSYCRLRFNIEG